METRFSRNSLNYRVESPQSHRSNANSSLGIIIRGLRLNAAIFKYHSHRDETACNLLNSEADVFKGLRPL